MRLTFFYFYSLSQTSLALFFLRILASHPLYHCLPVFFSSSQHLYRQGAIASAPFHIGSGFVTGAHFRSLIHFNKRHTCPVAPARLGWTGSFSVSPGMDQFSGIFLYIWSPVSFTTFIVLFTFISNNSSYGNWVDHIEKSVSFWQIR